MRTLLRSFANLLLLLAFIFPGALAVAMLIRGTGLRRIGHVLAGGLLVLVYLWLGRALFRERRRAEAGESSG